MKKLILWSVCSVLLLAVAAPLMATPVPGIYYSTDLGGAMLLGRNSTSRACVNTCGGIGDVFNVASWNGTALGTQWSVVCGVETTLYIVNDSRVNGTGPVTYTSTFNGGTFAFNPGPWGSGSGILNTTIVISTVQFMNIGGVSTPVASRANIQSNGMFTNGCTLIFAIANGIGVGETPMVKPATYPTFIDTNCQSGRIYGNWGDVGQITLGIDCSTPAQPSNWGTIKSLYR